MCVKQLVCIFEIKYSRIIQQVFGVWLTFFVGWLVGFHCCFSYASKYQILTSIDRLNHRLINLLFDGDKNIFMLIYNKSAQTLNKIFKENQM